MERAPVQTVLDFCEQGVDGVVAAEVGPDREGLPADPFDGLDRFRGRLFLAAVVNGHQKTFRGEPLGNRPADSA